LHGGDRRPHGGAADHRTSVGEHSFL
jgi:hypothetical protein